MGDGSGTAAADSLVATTWFEGVQQIGLGLLVWVLLGSRLVLLQLWGQTVRGWSRCLCSALYYIPS